MRVVGAILSREREELLSNLGNHAQRTTAVEQLEKQVKEQVRFISKLTLLVPSLGYSRELPSSL